MTNPHRGDVPLEVGSKTYTLRYSHNALEALERAEGKGLQHILRELSDASNIRIGLVISTLWAGLQKHHRSMTREDAGDLLDEIEGGSVKAMDVIGEAMQRAFNAPGTKGTNPPQPMTGNGTGMPASSNTLATSTIPTPSGT